MGCYAAMNALKLARHIVRSEPQSKVAIVNLELCTLHLQETDNIEEVLSFLIFADGCSASIVSAEPDGIELESFRTTVIPGSADQITWHIGAQRLRHASGGHRSRHHRQRAARARCRRS